MARTSRRDQTLSDYVPIADEGKMHKTKGYVRLSSLDKTDGDSSLTNQKHIIEQYVKDNPSLKLEGFFSDNGESGTNFMRSGFQKLMEQARAGEIDCVIVKDLSRLGRNYIETGEYLENIFPSLGVRVIAINDGYDSLHNSNGITFNLKNLVNDIYAKDISRKVSTALRIKQKKGDFIGSFAAYGYVKDPNNKNKIIADEVTAPIVQDIFNWKAQGVGNLQICRKLNEAGIASPGKYLFEKGVLKNEKYIKCKWHKGSLKRLLQNPVYLGHIAQGKRNNALYENKSGEEIPASEWIIVENTHEPLIDFETYNMVQKIMNDRKDAYNSNLGSYDYFEQHDNVLKGLVFCADCGRPLFRYRSVGGGRKNASYSFQCQTYAESLDMGCTRKYVLEDELISTIQQALNIEIEKSVDIKRIVTKLNRSSSFKNSIIQFDKNEEAINARLHRISGLRQHIYDDFASKLLTKDEYTFAIKKFDEEKDNLKQKLNEILCNKQNVNNNFTPANKWISAFNKLRINAELTAGIVKEFIEKIIVSSDKSITIIFKFKDEYEAIRNFADDLGQAVNV